MNEKFTLLSPIPPSFYLYKPIFAGMRLPEQVHSVYVLVPSDPGQLWICLESQLSQFPADQPCMPATPEDRSVKNGEFWT